MRILWRRPRRERIWIRMGTSGPQRAHARRHLDVIGAPRATGARFDEHLAEQGRGPLARGPVTTLQVNLGRRCNQACLHCHVGAGPKRTEMMSEAALARLLELVRRSPAVGLVDVTGGAPELHPGFRDFVGAARALGRRVIDRCNLTILFEPGMDDLPEFFAGAGVEIVASLPCYSTETVDAQRGRGVFDKSVAALRRLNRLGYGQPGSPLRLDLVYNPGGAFLPPAQEALEAQYKTELRARFGIEFHGLLALANVPIERFAEALARQGQLESYMNLLVAHFNPLTVDALMCRSLVSVAWDGRLFDCDFNQMAELPAGSGARTIWEVDELGPLEGAAIATGAHCFACTAGAGSSCGGALAR